MANILSPVLIFFFVVFAPIPVSAQSEHIVGKTSEAQIQSEHSIFEVYTRRYQPDSLSVEYLRQLSDSVHVVVVLGTWCKDSKKHVPSLMKTLEVVNNPLVRAEYIGVDYSHQDPGNAYQSYGLNSNPTFIVFLDGREIGRIVEEPFLSIEEDLAKIIRKQKGLQE